MADNFLHGVEVLEIDQGPRPIRTVRSSVIGIIGTAPSADASKFPYNKPVLIAGSKRESAALGDEGTLPDAMDSIFDQAGAVVAVIRVEDSDDQGEVLANVIGGTNSATGDYEGIHAFLSCKSEVGFSPRILIAPGFTHNRSDNSANPVLAEMIGIAERLRAVIIADGPNQNDADALQYANDFGSDRIYLCDPWVKKFNLQKKETIDAPPSPCIAGLIAKIDNDLGFWWSPSNKNINGIVGVSRPVDFALGDINARANLLNEKNVATIIREDGYRLWGNRTLSSDPKWAFLSVRRTADIINDSLLRAHLWAVDRNISKTYIEDVTDGVNAYLRRLVALGAILGGECWADKELNTPDSLSQGKVYFDFDFTPPAPAEHITFSSTLTSSYFAEVV